MHKKQISMYGIEDCVNLFQLQLNSSVGDPAVNINALSSLTSGKNPIHTAFHGG